MTAPLLSIQDLIIEFDTQQGRRRVVDGVSFSVGQGEVLGILGESGSGKTLSTLSILGLVPGRPGVVSGHIRAHTDAGEVDFLAELPSVVAGGTAERAYQKDDRRWQRIVQRTMKPYWGQFATAVFQNPKQSLDPLMTIGRQLDESVALANPSLDRAAVRARSVDWLRRVQLHDPERVAASYAHELSGGMCQRAMIAVALAREPRLLIADEPTTGLDTTVRAEIVGLFKALLRDRRRAMLYISHDIREVLFLADRVIVMRHGKVLEETSADDLRHGRGRRHPYTASLLEAADLPVGEAA
jgi:ABC-type dipeptide/oligopeptide/nickel transport system ATPase component